MSVSPVMSITDELVAELESLYLAGWEASGEGWNAEYPGDAHETKGFTDLMHKSCAPTIAKLLAERAELLRDAERYRWLRDNWFQIYGESKGCDGIRISIGDTWNHTGVPGHVDAAIDASMQSEAAK